MSRGVRTLNYPIADTKLSTETDGLFLKAVQIFDDHDVSMNTRAEYKYRIKLFLKFSRERGRSEKSYLHYKEYLAQRTDFTASTKNKYLIVAKVFLVKLFLLGELKKDITRDIKKFSQGNKHTRTGLDETEVTTLMATIQQLPNTKYVSRLKALLALLAFQGLRQIEIVRLDFEDLDFLAATAMIQGKGRDDKELVALQPETILCLQTYVTTNKISSGPLFTSGEHGRRLSTRMVRFIIQKTLRGFGIAKSTHGFRHYFTTQLIKNYKSSLLEVKKYTRHKNIDMLEVYNDNITDQADLPRFYKTFEHIKLN